MQGGLVKARINDFLSHIFYNYSSIKINMLSSTIVTETIHQIFHTLDNKIAQVELIKSDLDQYSSDRVISLINQLGDQIFSDPKYQQLEQILHEPSSIPIDTFMNLNLFEERQEMNEATSIKAQSSPKHLKKRVTKEQNLSQQSQSKPMKDDKDQLKKLELNEKEDEEIQVLRIESLKKMEEEAKNNANSLKENNKGLESQIYFDYDGNVLTKHLNQKKSKNLISKGINGNVHDEIINQNKPKEEKVQSVVGRIVSNEKNQKKQIKRRKKVQDNTTKTTQVIEFSNYKDPTTYFECKSGVKIQHERKVIENRERQLSVKEIRKTITGRKLSKQEYRKLKSNPKRKQNTSHTQMTPAISMELRFQSQAKKQSIKKRSITEIGNPKNEKININNEELKKVLLKKMPQTTKKQQYHFQQEAEQQKEDFNRIDKYNMDYVHNKVNSQQSQRPFQKESIQFPKIHHIQTKSVLYPKTRERLVNAQKLKEVKKKFEDNLRT